MHCICFNSFTSLNAGTSIPFDVIFEDTHSAWSNTEYTIPLSGIWVISLNIGAPSNGYHADLVFSDFRDRPFDVKNNGYNLGISQASATVVVSLNVSCTVYAKIYKDIYNTGPVYSDTGYQTSMMGFMYSPATPLHAVAWCATLEDYVVSSTEPLPFTGIITNVGGGWDKEYFKPPFDGLYYVTISGLVRGYEQIYMRYEVMVGPREQDFSHGAKQASVNSSGGNSKVITSTRAIILRLTTADKLWISLPYNSEGYGSESGHYTWFAGFRISP